MGVSHNLLPLARYFEQVNCRKIIVNDIPLTAGMTDQDLLSCIMSIYEGDVVSTIPSCDCPEGTGLRGGARLGQICSICNGEVREAHDRLDSNLWLRQLSHPDYGPIPFINPIYWIIFSRELHAYASIDFLRYMTDDKYVLSPDVLSSPSFKPIGECVEKIMGGERDYLVFINNLDAIFQFLINHSAYKNKKRPMSSASVQLDLLYKIYLHDKETNRGQGLFPDYMPIFSKAIFVMEKNPKGRYVCLKSAVNVDVVKSWIRICEEQLERERAGLPPMSLKAMSRETARVVSKLSSLYLSYLDDYMFKKSGHLRKNIYGARTFFCARAVIVSIDGPHDRRDVHIPWTMATTIFKPQLENKLLRLGYSLREITRRLYACVNKYDELIHSLLLEMLADGPDGCIPMIVHRNPTLKRGSSLLCRIKKIKTDPRDKTVGISILTTKYTNADFDGDILNFYPIMDQTMLDLFEPFSLKYNVSDMNKPWGLSGHLSLLEAGNGIVSEFLLDKDNNHNDTLYSKLKKVKIS